MDLATLRHVRSMAIDAEAHVWATTYAQSLEGARAFNRHRLDAKSSQHAGGPRYGTPEWDASVEEGRLREVERRRAYLAANPDAPRWPDEESG